MTWVEGDTVLITTLSGEIVARKAGQVWVVGGVDDPDLEEGDPALEGARYTLLAAAPVPKEELCQG